MFRDTGEDERVAELKGAYFSHLTSLETVSLYLSICWEVWDMCCALNERVALFNTEAMLVATAYPIVMSLAFRRCLFF